MPFPNKDTQFKPGTVPNPNGRPKGSKSWSTVIRNLLEDEDFEIKFTNGDIKRYPAFVIAEVMAKKAASGDTHAATWLAKYGYGDRVAVDLEGGLFTAGKLEVEIVTRDNKDSVESETESGAESAEQPPSN